MKADNHAGSAEKRALWEVRQRYNIGHSAGARKASPRGRSRHTNTPPAHQKVGARPPVPPSSPTGRLHPQRGGSWFRRLLLLLVLVVLLSGGVFGYKILAASNKISAHERSVLGQLKDLLFSSGRTLSGESDGRINIMLIAIGGEGHKGQNLADTVMLASIRPQDNQVALLSIPRDLYVQVPDEAYYSKINSVHAYGESQKTGRGPDVLRRTVEDITGQTVHYYARVDFTAFKQIVDAVGGVDITIDESFFDYWHKIAFPAGTERMDGERALAYVRARYIEGSEGGDFKRAARQQQVLLSLREKVFSVNTALDFTALNSILNSLSSNIRTDMQLWEMKRFYEVARQLETTDVRSIVLTSGPRGVLVGTTEVLGGTPASVLKTRTGDYRETRDVAANIFAQDVAVNSAAASPPRDEPAPSPSPTAAEEPVVKPTVEIRNGTNLTGLAAATRDDLQDRGFEVVAISNAKDRATPATVVYALTDDAADATKEIATLLEAKTDSGLPEGETATDAGILIILGADAG